MYASIQYDPAATAQQVLADVVAIMTGPQGMLLSALTGPRNDAGSFLTSTIAGGWTVLDAVDASNVVLQAPISDDPTKFKIVKLEIISATSNIKFEYYRSWNIVTHTGVLNKRISVAGSDLTAVAASINYVYYDSGATNSTQMILSASANHFAAVNGINNMTALSTPSILSEHTRMSPWDTVANGYLPVVQTTQGISQTTWSAIPSNADFWCKALWPATATTDYDINAAPATSAGPLGALTPVTQSSVSYPVSSVALSTMCVTAPNMLNANKVLQIAVQEMGCSAFYPPTHANYGGNISQKSGIYFCAKTGALNDIIVLNGDNYRIWPLPAARPTGAITGNNIKYFAVLEK